MWRGGWVLGGWIALVGVMSELLRSPPKYYRMMAYLIRGGRSGYRLSVCRAQLALLHSAGFCLCMSPKMLFCANS